METGFPILRRTAHLHANGDPDKLVIITPMVIKDCAHPRYLAAVTGAEFYAFFIKGHRNVCALSYQCVKLFDRLRS